MSLLEKQTLLTYKKEIMQYLSMFIHCKLLSKNWAVTLLWQESRQPPELETAHCTYAHSEQALESLTHYISLHFLMPLQHILTSAWQEKLLQLLVLLPLQLLHLSWCWWHANSSWGGRSSSEITDLTLDHWCDMAAPEMSIVRRNGRLIPPNGHSVIATCSSQLEGSTKNNFYMKRKRVEGLNSILRETSLQRQECTFHCL